MKEMKDALARIHASLSHTKEVDPELREKLVTLDQDIRRLLEKEKHAPFAYAGLENAARDLEIGFARAHPNVALLVRQLADILGKMGI
ncbi:MAG: DUF4404 family protein [Burkholderiaceae bacterium]|jgi:hypothetical protein|nr:DUF4404 family protein [Burkholderiaceae bacterium]